jgi:hypothetical protein
MLRIFSIISSIFFLIFFTLSTFAASVKDASTELRLDAVKVIDSKTVRLSFSDGIDMTSVVLKIIKQSDNASIAIKEIWPIEWSPDIIDVFLDDELEEGSSYTLTVQAAIGTSGSTIIDGAGALKEFVTPSPLTRATPLLNAPPNPAAVLVDEDNTVDTPKPITPKPVEPEVIQEETPVPTEELPLTGMNPFLFLLVIFPIAYIFLRKRSH